ncbi:MAG: ABC transporter permease [Candidatus Bathyarchaeota archaeon]|nr:ABC transporter permease [Candidatus Bathyarchaeota archaeon]MDH5663075.1 ABC transporter permease [Candidatus Bathyarchaeota archaeon]
MFKGLFNIIVKEVKELVRDPKILLGMIIVPLIMFPLMGFAIQTSMEAAEESMGSISMAVMDLDKGPVAENLTNFLATLNIRIVEVDDLNLTEAVNYVEQSNLTGLIVIPPSFSDNITDGLKAELDVYTVFRGAGIAESTSSSAISALLKTFEEYLVVQKVGEKFPEEDPKTILDPIELAEKSIIKGKDVNIPPEVLFGLMMSQSLGMPIGIMMLLIFAMQLAATSVASEKEEKTLETLLTLPVNRFTILVGKLTGSIIVAVVGAVAYIVGFSYYMGSFAGVMPAGTGVDLAAIGLAPTPISYLLLGASLFMSLLSALALAISISIFAEDVRGAQALVGPLSILLIFPMIFTMFTDIYALPFPLMIVLLAIPFTHPMLAARAAFTGDYLTAIIGIVYVSIFTIAVLYIAARLFGTEKILTARLKFRRFRLRKSK